MYYIDKSSKKNESIIQNFTIKQITEDFDTFKKLTDTIVKQVGDIRRLADEFSFFARLPEPVLKQCQLYNIAKQAIFFMQNAYQDVNITISDTDINTSIMGDERLIHQAIINVIQNAINAIKSKGDNIVKKIIQDHGGNIILEDSNMSGARIILSFPLITNGVSK